MATELKIWHEFVEVYATLPKLKAEEELRKIAKVAHCSNDLSN